MMKHEFESLVNDSVSNELYEKIECLYMNLDYMFPSKIDIANYYMINGSVGIENLYTEFCNIIDLKTRIHELSETANSYRRLFLSENQKLCESNRKLREQSTKISDLQNFIELVHSELCK